MFLAVMLLAYFFKGQTFNAYALRFFILCYIGALFEQIHFGHMHLSQLQLDIGGQCELSFTQAAFQEPVLGPKRLDGALERRDLVHLGVRLVIHKHNFRMTLVHIVVRHRVLE